MPCKKKRYRKAGSGFQRTANRAMNDVMDITKLGAVSVIGIGTVGALAGLLKK